MRDWRRGEEEKARSWESGGDEEAEGGNEKMIGTCIGGMVEQRLINGRYARTRLYGKQKTGDF